MEWPMRKITVVTFLMAASPAFGQDITYLQDIRPIFRKHCIACHSGKNAAKIEVSGGLALDTFDAVKKGSKRSVITLGKADESLLYKLLVTTDEKLRMPLRSESLSKAKIELVKKWIDSGAKEGTPPAEISVSPTKKAI